MWSEYIICITLNLWVEAGRAGNMTDFFLIHENSRLSNVTPVVLLQRTEWLLNIGNSGDMRGNSLDIL